MELIYVSNQEISINSLTLLNLDDHRQLVIPYYREYQDSSLRTNNWHKRLHRGFQSPSLGMAHSEWWSVHQDEANNLGGHFTGK